MFHRPLACEAVLVDQMLGTVEEPCLWLDLKQPSRYGSMYGILQMEGRICLSLHDHTHRYLVQAAMIRSGDVLPPKLFVSQLLSATIAILHGRPETNYHSPFRCSRPSVWRRIEKLYDFGLREDELGDPYRSDTQTEETLNSPFVYSDSLVVWSCPPVNLQLLTSLPLSF